MPERFEVRSIGTGVGGATICSYCHEPIVGRMSVVAGFNMHPKCADAACPKGRIRWNWDTEKWTEDSGGDDPCES